MAHRFSIGEQNVITVELDNMFPFRLKGSLIDELPFQFQQRDFMLPFSANFQAVTTLTYTLTPKSRGEFAFGRLLCYAASPLGLLQRRFVLQEAQTVKVYPAFSQLRKYQLEAVAADDRALPGMRRLRKMGQSLEFEKIKEYVSGDDVRTINWKATARSNSMMVNMYTDARQQQVYCLLDKGRNMKMPFDGMTLLDYSINATLALLNVVLLRQDKAGLVTFSTKVNDIIPADRRNDQFHRIMETLYNQKTEFKETDYEAVWSAMHRKIAQRSLILLFTNFETYSSLERQLPFLKQMARNHLLCVVFFQNTLLEQIEESAPDNIEGIYIKTIAEQFTFEKRQIVKELRRHGILSILTTPANLNGAVINKYLEMKARHMA